MSSIAQALLEIQQAILGQFGDFADPSSFLVTAFEFGTPISSSSVHSPADPSLLSPEMALEFLSNLANVVPVLQNSFFVRGLATVDGEYQTLLEGAFAAQPSQADLFAGIVRDARADFDEELGSLLSLERFHPTFATPVDWFDPAANENWTPLHVEGVDSNGTPPSADLDPKLVRWRVGAEGTGGLPEAANPHPLLRAAFAPEPPQQGLAGPDPDDQFDPNNPQAKFPIKSPIEMVSQADFGAVVMEGSNHFPVIVEATRAPFIPILPFIRPRIRLEEAVQAARVPIHLLRYEIAENNKSNALPFVDPEISILPTGIAFLNGRELARAELTATTTNHAQLPDLIAAIEQQFVPPGTSRVLIDLEMCIVHLNRPWMSDRLLSFGNWFVPGFAAGDFSNGTDVSGNQRFATIPIAAALVRNLVVQARWTDADKDLMPRSINLGPFSLSGHDLDAHSGKLSVPGMQVIAWVCERMPTLPPSSEPA